MEKTLTILNELVQSGRITQSQIDQGEELGQPNTKYKQKITKIKKETKMDSGLSASDVLALTKDNDGLMGGNSWAWLIIILLFAGGGLVLVATEETVLLQKTLQQDLITALFSNREINNLFGIQNMNQGLVVCIYF